MQKPFSPKINHRQSPPRQFDCPREWENTTQRQLAADVKLSPNHILHSPNSTVHVSRNLLPKAQGFTPVQSFLPETNHTSGVKLNFTPISQPRTFVAERKHAKRRVRRAPQPYGAEQLRGPNRKTTQYVIRSYICICESFLLDARFLGSHADNCMHRFPISPNSDRANNVWREVVNIPGVSYAI